MSAPLIEPMTHTAQFAEGESRPAGSETVAAILKRCKISLIADWLVRTKGTPALNELNLSDKRRTGHLPQLVDDIVARLAESTMPTKDSDSPASAAARKHGDLRQMQGYSATMLIHESRILQVTIFGTLQKNLSLLDIKLLLPDVMTIADEVDSQLTQTMESFTNATAKAAKGRLVKPTVSHR
jgi:hypothetical protein